MTTSTWSRPPTLDRSGRQLLTCMHACMHACGMGGLRAFPVVMLSVRRSTRQLRCTHGPNSASTHHHGLLTQRARGEVVMPCMHAQVLLVGAHEQQAQATACRDGVTPPMRDARRRVFAPAPDLDPQRMHKLEEDLLSIAMVCAPRQRASFQ